MHASRTKEKKETKERKEKRKQKKPRAVEEGAGPPGRAGKKYDLVCTRVPPIVRERNNETDPS